LILYAREHGLRFGHDIVYTYGPAEFLFMPFFAKQTPAIRLVHDVILAYVVAVGICLVAWRMNRLWRTSFLAAFILSPAPWFYNGIPELVLIIGLFCWGLLTGMTAWAGWVLVVFVAWLGMAKVSFLLIGGMTILAIAIQRRMPLLIPAYLVTLFAAWMLLGQRMNDGWGFVRGALNMSSGYDAAMALTATTPALVMALLALAAVVPVILMAEQPLLFKGWAAALLFCVWKEGFVRADLWHQPVLFGFAPLCGIILGGLHGRRLLPKLTDGSEQSAAATDVVGAVAWPEGAEINEWKDQGHGRTRSYQVSRGKKMRAGAIAACWLFSGIGLCFVEPTWMPFIEPGFLEARLTQNLHILIKPQDYRRATYEAVAHEEKKSQLPNLRSIVANSPVDVFGWDVSYAVVNGLNYTPRPCAQSYAAYTPELIRRNAEFYRTNPPAYVIFQLEPLGAPLVLPVANFPPAADALILRHLILNYEPAAGENDVVLLKQVRRDSARLVEISSGHLAANQEQPVPESPEPLWCEAACARHRFRRFIYSEPLVMVKVLRGEGESRYNASRPQLAAGFCLNPLLLTTRDIYRTNAVSVARAVSFSEPVDCRLYRVERVARND
jgi:hypothetical protein